MSEYISREAALQALEVSNVHHGIISALQENLRDIPAADVVEVRHGRWVWDGGEDMHYYCSQCHHNAYGCTGEILDGTYRYCPSCGAKMARPEPPKE